MPDDPTSAETDAILMIDAPDGDRLRFTAWHLAIP
jgi:hypothetical protein